MLIFLRLEYKSFKTIEISRAKIQYVFFQNFDVCRPQAYTVGRKKDISYG